ncbi:CsiV family protein [Paraglaciecola sp. L3A3]|uniref:CsiV family protein n=1 Tax=Paraglaciecola sp. L3A3 TaxID=2686358 RepID=UPI00131D0786|nr:CsiV family protein [Paraglaciecola sp. L3A3]
MSNISKMQSVLTSSIKKAVTSLGVAVVTSAVLNSSAYAADKEWWFDVEVIVFTRDLSTSPVAEAFTQSSLLPAATEHTDLITSYLTPDLTYMRGDLPFCRQSKLAAIEQQRQKDFAFPQPIVEAEEQTGEQVENSIPELVSVQTDETVNTETTTDENFEYQVATTDIFADQDKDSASKLASAAPALKDKIQETELAKQLTEESLNEESAIQYLPITINWIEWQIPAQLPCAYAEQVEPSIEFLPQVESETVSKDPLTLISQVPKVINGVEWLNKSQAPFLLPQDQLRMTELYTSIKKQRGIEPMIHLAWRQQVTFGADNAQGYRLFAGDNFAAQFDINGQPKIQQDVLNQVQTETVVVDDELYIPKEEREKLSASELEELITKLKPNTTINELTEEDLLTKIEQALLSETIIDKDLPTKQTPDQTELLAELTQLWGVDGFIKVYLQNVGRVPYLHINSNLDYRHPILNQQTSSQILANGGKPTEHLQSVNFNQLRRVISKQIHYFDHPLFGMVVTINRYNWPVENTDPVTDNE